MALELWDTATANLIGEYANEGDALRDLAKLLNKCGEDFVAGTILAREDPDTGESEVIQTGPSLLKILAKKARNRRDTLVPA